MLGMHIKFLDKAYFGGFCQPLKSNSEVYTMQSNCCEKIESKVYDLKLVLDDWSNFTDNHQIIAWGHCLHGEPQTNASNKNLLIAATFSLLAEN